MNYFLHTFALSILSMVIVFVNVQHVSAEIIIMIDAGHGGASNKGSYSSRTLSKSNSAKSPNGILEKDLTLELSKSIISYINGSKAAQNGRIKAVGTRFEDINLDFSERAKKVNRSNASSLVSIHFNSSKGKANYTLAVIEGRKNNDNYQDDHRFATGLITVVDKVMRKRVGRLTKPQIFSDDEMHDGRGSNFFYQLRQKSPSILEYTCFLEVAFIDNPYVEKKLLGNNKSNIFKEITKSIGHYIISFHLKNT